MRYVHTPEKYPNVEAIKWTGENADQLAKTFIDKVNPTYERVAIAERLNEILAQAPKGSYIFEEKGEVNWIAADFFEKNYTKKRNPVIEFFNDILWGVTTLLGFIVLGGITLVLFTDSAFSVKIGETAKVDTADYQADYNRGTETGYRKALSDMAGTADLESEQIVILMQLHKDSINTAKYEK